MTIDRLQRSSVSPDSIGNRYARSLYLLWRKTPQKQPERQAAETAPSQTVVDPALQWRGTGDLDPLNGFSWRDLDALGQFITSDLAVTDSMLASPSFNTEQTANGLDSGPGEWADLSWSGNDIVF